MGRSLMAVALATIVAGAMLFGLREAAHRMGIQASPPGDDALAVRANAEDQEPIEACLGPDRYCAAGVDDKDGKSGEQASESFDTRIMGGSEVTSDVVYPWIVSIGRVGKPNPNAHFCGGSIVAPDWVVTAAHCLDRIADPSLIKITYGTHVLSAGGTTVGAAAIFIHPQWSRASFDNDVALIRLAAPAPAARVIPLLSARDAATLFGDGADATVAGWGKTETLSVSDKLRHVQLKTVSQTLCNARESYDNLVTKNMVCVGFEAGQKDSCQGDSGGPLMVSDLDGVRVLAGIVSWGRGCALPKKYGIYTRVAQYSDNWLRTCLSGGACPALALPK